MSKAWHQGSQRQALSESELEALLADWQTPSGRREGKAVKAYDFRRPDKFSKEQLRALQVLHETFARFAGSALSAYLRTHVQMHLARVAQSTYDEFVEQVPTSSIVGAFSMEPLPGRSCMEMDLPFAFALIDRLLGGSGQVREWTGDITDIELTLLHGLMGNVLSHLRDAWANLETITPKVESVVLSAQSVQAAFPGDVVLLVDLEARLGETEGKLTLCFPYSTLEPIIPRLSAELWLTGARQGRSDERLEKVRHQVERASILLVVQLGTAEVELKDLLDLKPGDIICLDRSEWGQVEVLVGGRPKFLGRPGTIHGQRGVEITSTIEEE